MNYIRKNSASLIIVVVFVTIMFSVTVNFENKVSADISECDFEVIGGVEEVDYRYIAETYQLEILTGESLLISMKDEIDTTNKDSILLNDNADITISDVAIKNDSISNAAINVASDASITLNIKGNNSIISYGKQAGIRVSGGSSITIIGEGSLYAEGAENAAGIGSSLYYDEDNNIINDLGNIIINSGNIKVQGGNSASGIGGGYNSSGGSISINGGIINATGGKYAAAIGTGLYNTSGSIKITDGDIIANGGVCAPGVGVGYKSDYGDIEISGGTISAIGGDYGAGIGSGYGNSEKPCNVAITGGKIHAKGGLRGSGIGMSHLAYHDEGAILIVGGEITATGGTYAAGIGYAGLITIDGGNITTEGGRYAAGIGGSSRSKSGGTLIINNGNVKSQGGVYAAGIGGAYDGSGGNIEINGGMVTSTGGDSGAGIGGGEYGHGANICINNGTVLAYGFNKKEYSGAGIGGGYRGAGNHTEINGGFITADGGTGAEDIGDGDRYIGSKTFTTYINGGSVWAVDGKINLPSGAKSKNGEPVYPVFIGTQENKTNSSTLNKNIEVDKYNYSANTISSTDGNCEHGSVFSNSNPSVAAIIYLQEDNFVNGIDIEGLPRGFADVEKVTNFKAKTNVVYWNINRAGIYAVLRGAEGKDYEYNNNVMTLYNDSDVEIGLYTYDIYTGDNIVVSPGATSSLQISGLMIDNRGSDSEVINVSSDSSLKLSLDGRNTLYGADNCAAISVDKMGQLSIFGAGGLIAYGGTEAAALGANKDEYSGKVVIQNGFVTAKGGDGADDIDNPVIDGGSVWFVGGISVIPKDSTDKNVYPVKVPTKNPLSEVDMYNREIKIINSTYKAKTVSEHKEKCEHGENFPSNQAALLYLPADKEISLSVGSFSNGIVSVVPDSDVSSDMNMVKWPISIKLNVSERTIENRSATNLYAIFNPSYIKNKNVLWTSSNTKIATVSGGKVTAKKTGTVYITARASYNSAVCVKAKLKIISPVTGIAVPQTKIYMTKKKTYSVPVVAYTKDGSSAKLVWKSSNIKIATVSSKGKITAKKTGKCVITVKSENGKYKNINVNVVKKAKKIKKVIIKNAPKAISKGMQKRLYVKLKSGYSTNVKVNWSSSNNKIISIDKSGLVKANNKGTATIKVKTGNVSATVKITVK